MEFCVIAPAAGLQRYATLSKSHLVLSHVKNALYREFYRQRAKEGDLIILDNGAYEGELNEQELLEAIAFYMPKVIVLPDILLGDSRLSLERSVEFHERWRDKLKVEWMFVPQAKPNHIHEFTEILLEGIRRIKPKWVGLPRILATHLALPTNKNYIRADYCRLVKGFYPDINVHALGMAAGNIIDLDNLRDAGCQSIDSSAPVWRGWNGFSLSDPSWEVAGSALNFNAPPLESERRHQLILSNLGKCL